MIQMCDALLEQPTHNKQYFIEKDWTSRPSISEQEKQLELPSLKCFK
jgi:hypothetical protein